MIVYAWNEISVTVTGSVWRCIHCEKCGGEYSFTDQKKVTCAAHSALMLDDEGAARLAGQDAEKEVRRLLEYEIGAVPCPHCGWYQQSMMRAIRKPLFRWIPIVAWNLFYWCWVVGLLVHLTANDFKGPEILRKDGIVLGIVGSLMLAVILLILRYPLRAMYNPNRAIPQEERKMLGRRFAIFPEQSPIHALANLPSANDQGPPQSPTAP